MKKKHRLTKKQRNKFIRNVVILTLIHAIPFVVNPELRTWVMENPLTMLLCVVQVIVLFSVLMFGAYLLLKWVRAEKKEEDKV